MGYIKLEYNNKSILLKKSNDKYQISNIKEWIMLTKFTKAYMIITHPNGYVSVSIDPKFVYNQEFELINDLDFEFRYIYPMGNFHVRKLFHPHPNLPFSGKLNGNNHTIKNINLINCENTGLFGVATFSTIENLIIQNVFIDGGNNVGSLFGKAFDIKLCNIKLVGNLLLKGDNVSGIGSQLEGEIKNILIAVDGELEGKNTALISNNFHGNIEYSSFITNLINTETKLGVGLFNIINGRLKNSNIISHLFIQNPFYTSTKYHIISDCYYFQLDENELPQLQDLNNCYYRNLTKIIYCPENFDSKNWIQLNNNYYLPQIINYSNDPSDSETIENNHMRIYNVNNETYNFSDYFIKINRDFTNGLNKINKNEIINKCQIMEEPFKNELDEYNKMINNIKNQPKPGLGHIMFDINKKNTFSENNDFEL
jgi:hypothetical protein